MIGGLFSGTVMNFMEISLLYKSTRVPERCQICDRWMPVALIQFINDWIWVIDTEEIVLLPTSPLVIQILQLEAFICF